MRVILWLTAVAAILYGVYWVIGSRAILKETEASLIGLKAGGLADYASIGLTGFPSRFDVRVDVPKLISADGLVRWSAPFVQIYALSYRPNHIIAELPAEQALSFGPERISIVSEDARASVVFGGGTDLALDRGQMVARRLRFTSDIGMWQSTVKEARLAFRSVAADRFEHEIGVEIFGIDHKGIPSATLPLPERLDRLRLDAVLNLDGPLDRFTPQRKLRLLATDIRALEIDMGMATLRGKGKLTLDAAGRPQGRIDLRVTDWRMLLAMAVRLGWVRAEISPTVERALEQLAQSSGDVNTLEMPLVIRNGRISLGPFPLGATPQF